MSSTCRNSSADRLARLVGLLALACVIAGLGAVSASAAQTRPYTGVSIGPDGAAGVGSFQDVESLAVDQSTGDLYVLDGTAGKVYKFDSSGEPRDFSSTGTNVIAVEINGVKSHNQRPLAGEYQIAVAPADAPGGTAGDIYVASSISLYPGPVWVYAASGVEIGEILPSENSCGVATSPAGNLFIASQSPGRGIIREYIPSANPPAEEDFSKADSSFAIGAIGVCNIAVADTGEIYLSDWAYGHAGGVVGPDQGIYRLQDMADTAPMKIDGEGSASISLDPSTGTLFAHRVLEVAEYGASGNELLGVLGAGQVGSEEHGVAVDASANRVYVGAGDRVKLFGNPVPVPSVAVAAPEAPVPSEAVLHGSVNPSGLPVTECFFEYGTSTSYGHTIACEALPPTNSEADLVKAAISGLQTDGVTYHFRLVAANANGPERSRDGSFVTGPTVVSEAAAPIAETSATLHGLVFPDGLPYSGCKFEYGLTTHAGFEDSVECAPSASAIPVDQTFHEVSANLTGLRENNAAYRYRLVATNAHGTVEGATMRFTTSGEPDLAEVRARDADQHSVTLEGKIDPRGFGTTYQIEWGPTSAYGTIATSGRVTADEAAKQATIRISGLDPGTVYHYRIMARSRRGNVSSGDREVETLNSCGLPDGRCLELVSPRDAGPVAYAESGSGVEPGFQAAGEPGSVDFMLNTGLPNSTRGAEILYHGLRGPGGWSATPTQVSPPIIARNETSGTSSGSAKIKGLSEDLSCGFVETNQPLTHEASTRLVVEAGGTNLYRRNPDGSYTAVSALTPENLDAVEGSVGSEYVLAGFSHDCGKVVFISRYQYPGVGGAGESRLYEWTEGALRTVGMVPGPGGEVAVAATPGGSGGGTGQYNLSNVVSGDGSKIFFSARRQASPNPAEIGTVGVFVRENGTLTKDLSLSETSTPDEGATYQWATKDGSRVFFTANAGLTALSSEVGSDLYEYDLEDEALSDLSVDREAGGAQVAGFIGASEDGSHVYFVARGQLVPGAGGTLAENLTKKMYSVYGEKDGEVSYVGAIRESQLGGVIISGGGYQTSRVSSDGRYLIFESSVDLTGYESGNGIREVYLYDADAHSEATVCVSCRQDGKQSVATFGNQPLPVGGNDANPLYDPYSLAEHDGEAEVFFTSFDSLAPGASDGRANLYEWSHGQVFLITTEPPGLHGPGGEGGITEENVSLAGASPEGTDLYFTTPQTLTWEDGDERSSYYDARIGGGFPAPPPTVGPCEPASEGSCQGPATSGGAAIAGPPTSQFNGPGNPQPQAKHKGKRHRHHRKDHHRKKHDARKHGHGKRSRAKRGQMPRGETKGIGRAAE